MDTIRRFALSLLVILVGGFAGVALDLDHILILIAKGLPITLVNLATQAGRPLHIPLVVVCGIVCLVALSRHVRLLADVGADN